MSRLTDLQGKYDSLYETEKNSFQGRLIKIMIERNTYYAKLSADSGIPPRTIESYCRGQRNPSANAISALCDSLDCDSEYLYGLQDVYRRNDNTFAEEYGLTEKAANRLKHIGENKRTRKILCELLTNPEFENLLEIMFLFVNSCDYDATDEKTDKANARQMDYIRTRSAPLETFTRILDSLYQSNIPEKETRDFALWESYVRIYADQRNLSAEYQTRRKRAKTEKQVMQLDNDYMKTAAQIGREIQRSFEQYPTVGKYTEDFNAIHENGYILPILENPQKMIDILDRISKDFWKTHDKPKTTTKKTTTKTPTSKAKRKRV